MRKRLFAYINTEGEFEENIAELVKHYFFNGADGIYLYSSITNEVYREEFFRMIKRVTENLEIPFYIGTYVSGFEDIKKAFYTGAVSVVVPVSDILDWEPIVREAVERFGSGAIYIELNASGADTEEGLAALDAYVKKASELGVGGLMFKHVTVGPRFSAYLKTMTLPVMVRDSLVRNSVSDLLSTDGITILATNYYKDKDIRTVKENLTTDGIPMNCLESFLPFSEFKKDDKGLVPVVVQDYRTNEVLMMAYMNEESYNKTVSDGRMTYFSRSRQKLWLKGETSGNFQYVKALLIDCDKDTILAKVYPVGPACHTGNRTCFFTELSEGAKNMQAPKDVLEELYDTIADRKANPKEGSYTCYLFEKGLDKILKKCGEEATEIVIAAKNPQKEELKYEIADYLYHLSVLMVENGVTWDEVMTELTNRK